MILGFFGMDILAIEHLARQLDTQAQEMRSASREIEALLENTSWMGSDRERFTHDWASVISPLMRRASEMAREASLLASQESRRQNETSRGY